jgi:hypothetical protein
MKVQAKVSLLHDSRRIICGREFEIDDAKAKALIAEGLVEAVGQETNRKEKAPAKTVKKTTSKRGAKVEQAKVAEEEGVPEGAFNLPEAED